MKDMSQLPEFYEIFLINSCLICSKTFVNIFVRDFHHEHCHGIIAYSCVVCNEDQTSYLEQYPSQFTNIYSLLNHMFEVQDDKTCLNTYFELNLIN